MKLFYSPTSPYARKVRVVLDLTGLAGACEIVAASGTPLAPNPDTVAVNPLGKVPCLVTDEGLTLYDSRVICRYLDHVAGAGLYPPAGFEVLVAEARADGVMDAALLAVYEARLRPETARFQPWIDGKVAKVQAGVAAMAADVALLSGPLTIAQVASGAALGYLDLRFGHLNWRAAHPALADWYHGFAATPAMQATVPEG